MPGMMRGALRLVLQRRQESVYIRLVGNLDLFIEVREIVAVIVQHDGELNIVIFRQFVAHDKLVGDFLVIFHDNLYPAGITGRYHILLAGRYGMDTGGLAVDVDHDDGGAVARGLEDGIVHINEAVRRSGGESPRAGHAGGQHDVHRGVFTFYFNDFRIERTIGNETGKGFGDFALGGDRIARNNFRAAHLRQVSGDDVAHHDAYFAFFSLH